MPVKRSVRRVSGLDRRRRACSTVANRGADGTRSPAARLMVTSPWPSSSDISPAIRWITSRCSGEAIRPEDAAVADPLASLSTVAERFADRVGDLAGVRVGEAQAGVDQVGEVIAHPRNPGELGSVGELVEQHPGSELGGIEAESALDRRQVRADHVDRVVDIVATDQQVVLAQHAAAHPTQQRAELGADQLATERRPPGRWTGAWPTTAPSAA